MPLWVHRAGYALAWFVVAMQFAFGAAEVFEPRFVFDRVLETYAATNEDPIWSETEKLARNMGLYNWFLAAGLLFTLTNGLGGLPTARFFLLCVTVAGAFGLISVGSSVAFVA